MQFIIAVDFSFRKGNSYSAEYSYSENQASKNYNKIM